MDYQLPSDPYMLLSYINMKLRDSYPSLDALCDDLGISAEYIIEPLRRAGFEYDPTTNSFS